MTFKQKTHEFVLSVSTPEAFKNLETYVNMIEEKNKVMNLTGFTGDRLWEEGIYESIISLWEIFKDPSKKHMLDIGAGAGFPSVPFKIVFPEMNLTIIEPINKRVNFLKEVSNALNLNIKLIIGRAEETKNTTFDLITARAVAPLYALLEISSHLGNIGTKYGFLKGPSIDDETLEAKNIIQKLGIQFEVKKLTSRDLDRDAYSFEYIKSKPTPNDIPRAWAKIVEKK